METALRVYTCYHFEHRPLLSTINFINVIETNKYNTTFVEIDRPKIINLPNNYFYILMWPKATISSSVHESKCILIDAKTTVETTIRQIKKKNRRIDFKEW